MCEELDVSGSHSSYSVALSLYDRWKYIPRCCNSQVTSILVQGSGLKSDSVPRSAIVSHVAAGLEKKNIGNAEILI